MAIEIVLCERDKNGKKTGKKVSLTGNMMPEYRAERVQGVLLRGLKGKKRQKARENMFATTENDS
jgi:hypothetical protein